MPPRLQMVRPVLRQIVNLWTLVWYPSREQEWSLERKLTAVKEAGFDGFTDRLTPEHARLGEQLGLLRVGFFSSSNTKEFKSLLEQQQAAGARYVNVQLGDHDTPTSEAVRLARELMSAGKAASV